MLHVPPLPSWRPRTGNQDLSGRIFFVQNCGKPYSLQKATTRGSLWRFEAYPGDYTQGQTDRIRSELQCSEKEAFGKPVWVSTWLKVPQLGAKCGLFQFHQTEDKGDFSGYPPIIFELERDQTLTIWTASVAAAVRSTSYGRTKRLGGVPILPNVWHHIVACMTFGWANDAALVVYLNGTKLLDLAGICMGMNDARGPYCKLGVYGEQDNEQHIEAEFSHFEICSSSLVCRTSSPISVDL